MNLLKSAYIGDELRDLYNLKNVKNNHRKKQS